MQSYKTAIQKQSYLVGGHRHQGDEVPKHVGVLKVGHLSRKRGCNGQKLGQCLVMF